MGVGTTSPLGLLHLYASHAYDVLRLQYDAGGGGNWGINPFILGVSNGGLSFVDNLNSRTPLAISNQGNVGISTTAPSERLDVNGNAIADIVKARTNFNLDNTPLLLDAFKSGSIGGAGNIFY